MGLGTTSWIGSARPLAHVRGRSRWARPAWEWPLEPSRPEAEEPTVPPPEGRREEDADIVIVVDNSGSTAETDAEGFRHIALRRILNLLVDGIDGDPRDDRVAVVCFADYPYSYCPLTEVRSRAGRRKIRSFLRPVSAGGTSIVPAIERAGHLARARRDRTTVFLIFTDGESPETTAELNSAIDRLPMGSLHVVVLGSSLPPQWNDARAGSITPISDLTGPEDLEWALARALYRSLDLRWAGSTRPPRL
jgi:Mg-chelatase subunit ChlD